MASFSIHLAIGKLYIQKNKINDAEKFMYGTIAPDLEKDKNKSHYTGIRTDRTLKTFLETKVILSEFLKQNKIDTDYMKGIFLHLVTDFLFYNLFLSKDYLERVSYDKLKRDIYYSYECTNEYLKRKYQIDLNLFRDKVQLNNEGKNIGETGLDSNILNIDELDDFIEKISNIDLDKYAEQIVKSGTNILPDEFGNYVILKKRG